RKANELGLVRKPWVKSSFAPGSKAAALYLEEAGVLKDLEQLGDGTVKKRLEGILKELISPIRERREALAKDPDYIMDILREG
ncbi:hypothetical protein, partial [Acinetobacter soli]|uniref:hypothetical protein n=1 Tax=Acinetobacter soli TaxID=487316 RepID=UPI0020917198